MKAGNCRHFTGIQNDTCKAGVAYESVKDKSVRPLRIPCHTVSWRNQVEPCATTWPCRSGHASPAAPLY